MNKTKGDHEKPFDLRESLSLTFLIVVAVLFSVCATAAFAQQPNTAPTEEDFRGALEAMRQQRDFAQGQHAGALADLNRAVKRITELEAKVKALDPPKPEPAKKAP